MEIEEFLNNWEEDENGCWIWQGHLAPSGYGYVHIYGSRVRLVHRVMYETLVAEIPEGFFVDHVWARGCRSKACMSPYHLEAVTPTENTRRYFASVRELRSQGINLL